MNRQPRLWRAKLSRIYRCMWWIIWRWLGTCYWTGI